MKPGDAIPPQSDLKTGRESALEVKYEDGSSFLLRSDTQVKVILSWKTRSARLLRDFFLSAGRFIAKVREATGGQPLRFRVHTPSAIASVRGTEFRVSVDQKQKTFVEVLKRRVTVDTAKKSIDLVQGEGAMVKNASPLPTRKLLASPDPVDLKKIYNTAPAIAFTKIDGAHAYRVMTARDQQGKQLVRENIIKPGETVILAGLPDGAYYLLTQSIDSIGLEGAPSNVHPFIIRENPLPPIISTAAGVPRLKEKAAIFEWLTVCDADRYHIQIAEDRAFQKVILDNDELKDTTCKVDGLENKPYYFRIRSIAQDEYKGAWSDTLSFTPSPATPTPQTDKTSASTDEMVLKSKSIGEGFIYYFQIAADDKFKEIIIDQKVNKPEIKIQKPKKIGVYFVRTAVIDRSGKIGEFSQPQNFEIKRNIPYKWIGIGGGGGLLLLLLLLTL